MASLKAYKMDGLGNSFIIIDRRDKTINLSKNEIIKLKKTENFDQLIYIEEEQSNILPIKIYNQDGEEVDACGNGSRCVAYILGKEKNINEINLKTKNRTLTAYLVKDQIVKINMGKPNFAWNKIPISKKIDHKNISLPFIVIKDIETITIENLYNYIVNNNLITKDILFIGHQSNIAKKLIGDLNVSKKLKQYPNSLGVGKLTSCLIKNKVNINKTNFAFVKLKPVYVRFAQINQK